MKKIIGFLLCLGLGSAIAAPLHKIVAFGDSLSDNGNLYRYMHEQIPLSPPYFEGRFTSGPVWVEHVAAHYFPSNPEAHLVDYAFGGSGIDPEEDEEDDIDDGAMLTLKSQIDSYLLAHHDKADPSNLYTVWMGSNNYLGLPDDGDAEMELVLNGIHKELVHLAESGAKHIMVLGLPNLGAIPMAAEFEAEEELSNLSLTHNKKLEEDVHELEEIYPEVQWFYYDVNALLEEALMHPEQYGFEDVTGTCYEAIDYTPSSQPILSMASRVKPQMGAESDVCDTFLFFDPVHPAGRSHEHIAREAILQLDAGGITFG